MQDFANHREHIKRLKINYGSNTAISNGRSVIKLLLANFT